MLSTRLFVVKSKHFRVCCIQTDSEFTLFVRPVVTLRLQFSASISFRSPFDFHLFSICPQNIATRTHTHTLSLTSPIFKWTRTGFSMLLGFHYVEAASEKLIKLLINRFCVKHKYELRRFFSLSLSFHSCYSTPAEYGKRSKNLGSFFCRFHNKRLQRIIAFFFLIYLCDCCA